MRMKKENDRRNHVGTTFEMAFDTTPNYLSMNCEGFPSCSDSYRGQEGWIPAL